MPGRAFSLTLYQLNSKIYNIVNKKRIFTSIDLPDFIKNQLKTVAKRDIYWIKWMKADNFHITLNFLGDLNANEVELATQVLQDTVSGYSEFELCLKEFRGERDMLWLLAEKNEIMERLRWDLRVQLKNAGVGKRERHGYVPHVLLAKSKTGRRMTWLPKNYEPLKFRVDRINLYESRLTPGAATHTLIQSFVLNK